MSDSSSDRNPVEELAEQFAQRLRHGERPSLSEYVKKYPQYADEIRDLFPALAVMEQLKPTAGDLTGEHESSFTDELARHTEYLGDYRILREVGRGGMGVVYEAEQVSLGRHVALKLLSINGLVDPRYLERFRREAKAAARLHHTNIVPVFGVGECQGVYYYAMQFIQGEPLDRVLRDVRRFRNSAAAVVAVPSDGSVAQRFLTGRFAAPTVAEPGQPIARPDDTALTAQSESRSSALSDTGSEAGYFRTVARIGLQVADALTYAHRQGVLHRDVKPSNLLLDLDGTVWITDFGLAKAEGHDDLTQTGDIVGTVRFMAPERFEGHSLSQSDVYSLGLTLYELLTLRPAFDDTNKARLVERVLHEPPVPPRKVDAHVPRDLETVVLKCLAKDPTERYATAESLAEDLRRYLADRPIRARRTPAHERAWRWCRRNPVVACLLTAVAGLLVVIAVVSSLMAWRLSREHDTAVDNWHQAQEAERKVKVQLLQSRLTQARAGRFSRQAGRRFDGLSALAEAAALARELDAPAERFLELRNEAIACMALTDVRPVRRLEAITHGGVTNGFEPQVAFDSRWEMYARGDVEGGVSVRRLADDQEVAHFAKSGHVATILLFSPEGRYLAAKFYRSHSELPVEYVVWDWRQGKEVLRQPCAVLTRPLTDFAFTGDGRQLIVGGRRDGSLGFFDLASGQEVRRLSLGVAAYAITLHPDGKRLAVNKDSTVMIWHLDTGKVLASWKATSIWGLAWQPDGNLLAVGGGEDHCIHLWDTVTGQKRVLEGHENAVIHVTFNHAGTLLASWGWNGPSRLWDAYSGRELVTVPGHQHLGFSPDDRSLAYSRGKELGIWEVAHERVYRTLYANGKGLGHARFSPSGRLIASAGDDGVRLWDTDAGRQLAHLPVGPTHTALFARGGDCLLMWGNQGLYRWPLRSGAGAADHRLRLGPPQPLPVPMSARLQTGNCDQHQRILAVVDFWQKGIVVHLDDPARPTLLIGHDHVAVIALSPDGRWAATATFKGVDVKIWDLSQGKRPQPVHTIAGAWGYVRFSPDGRWLVVAGGGGYRFYTAGSWELDPTMSKRKHRGPVFAADAAIMAVSSDGSKHVELIVSDTGRELATLTPQDSQTMSFPSGFSADGTRLAATTSGHAIQLWDLRAVRRQLVEMGLDWGGPPYPRVRADSPSKPLTLEVVGPIPSPAPDSPTDNPAERLRGQLALYTLATVTAPFHPEPYHQRGHVYQQLNQPRQAVADFTEARGQEGLWAASGL